MKPTDTASDAATHLDRRTLLVGSGLVAAGLVSVPVVRGLTRPRAGVFVAARQRYDGAIERTIRDGFEACGLIPSAVRGKRVLLKPNLVEPTRESPHMTTHPAVVRATAAVFRGWGADVVVGEGPGHLRDSELAVEAASLREVLDEERLTFADLNYEDTAWLANAGCESGLEGFYFPRSVLEADMIVSLPKMKTHHWMGVTAALKNMYGVIPGVRYGWPKNVLHHHGIPQTVFDINASLPKVVTVIDGIDCMEGDGPIMGTRKHMGVLLVGVNPTAVDATVCRLMGMRPDRIPYLALASDKLGPVRDRQIEQRGEPWEPFTDPFAILDRPHLTRLRDTRGPLVS